MSPKKRRFSADKAVSTEEAVSVLADMGDIPPTPQLPRPEPIVVSDGDDDFAPPLIRRQSRKRMRASAASEPKDEATDRFREQSEIKSDAGSQPSKELSEQQKLVVDFVASGKSVFITGTAGSGKSFLLQELVRTMKSKKMNVFVTASVGIAAVNVGGITIHSFAGIGMGREEKKELLRVVQASRRAVKNWQKCDVLIIDECSMLSGELFEKLDFIARNIRSRTSAFFGGVQVVLVGDFLQLPPVLKDVKDRTPIYRSNSWKEGIQECVELVEVFRQSELGFLEVLNKVRHGIVDDQVHRLLENCVGRQLEISDGVLPTQMFCTNADVDAINDGRLKELQGEITSFEAIDTGEKKYTDQLARNCQAPKTLKLKEGAQVMLTRNLDVSGMLCNGSRGVIVGFSHHFPVVHFACGIERRILRERWETMIGDKIVATRAQIPLKLAWAITIHRSQGMTLDRMEVSLRRVFETGQAYVALSRARSLAGLRILDFNPRAIRADLSALKFYRDTFGEDQLRAVLAKNTPRTPESQRGKQRSSHAAASEVDNGTSISTANLREEPHQEQKLQQSTVSQGLSLADDSQESQADEQPRPNVQKMKVDDGNTVFQRRRDRVPIVCLLHGLPLHELSEQDLLGSAEMPSKGTVEEFNAFAWYTCDNPSSRQCFIGVPKVEPDRS